jgi:hypothetical protein
MLDPATYALMHCVNPDTGKPLGFEGYEYLLQPLNDLSPHLVLQKGAQIGATVLAILRTLWFLDVRKAHSLYLFPTHKSALRFSKGRFAVLVERSPRLKTLFRSVKTGNHMRAGAVNFYCHGARSRNELMSLPIQYLTIDERDEMYQSTEGSQQPWSAVDLARQRLKGQAASWELDLSTPTIPNHGIHADFLQSDQHFFHPRCPYCGKWSPLVWPDSVAEPGEFRCADCHHVWEEATRRQALREGLWIPSYPGRPLRGYHLPQLLSPVVTATGLLRDWEKAQGHATAVQVFHNAVLGLPYVAEGARLERHFLEEAMAKSGSVMETHATQPTVMGIDVGPTWLHVVLAAPCVIGLRLVWAGKVSQWGELPVLFRQFQVQCFVIDAQPETHLARDLVATYPFGWLCYYRSGPGSLLLDPTRHILRVSRTESLDAMYRLWRLGHVAAPTDLPEEFLLQMQSPIRVLRLRRDGQPWADYLDSGTPDHFAHAMNYCHLALQLRGEPLKFEVTVPREGETAW